jgi:serine/threonine protein kinase
MIGRTLTHYKVVGELGAGGMGIVYKALDLRLDRHVALKILPADKSDDGERRARFLHEARAASALNDPHIVTIFDIFTDEGTDVLVMEFVQGRTLREILNDGPMPVARAIEIAAQVAEGVGAAHAAGIVHRDLKPGNVMVTERGRVKVLDFGLAKLVGGSFAEQPTMIAPTTVAGMLLGTVDYMSPEQAKGDPIDARSDVFSLGSMLYEMLTGTRPFVASHPVGVLHEILYGTVAPPSSRRPELTPEIDAIVLRALERDRTRRAQSMEWVASDLRRVQRRLDTEDQTVATAAPPIVPPPLPSQSPKPAAVADRVPSQAPLPQMPEPITLSGASYPVPPPRERRPARGKKARRPRWMTAIIVISIIYTVNWVRTAVKPTPRASRPPAAGDSRGDRFGAAVEDTVAEVLKDVAPNSPAIQLARGKIYWERAQKDKDAELMKKAEDAFNEVLRLNPDADDEAEAREALREIAAAKEPIAAP